MWRPWRQQACVGCVAKAISPPPWMLAHDDIHRWLADYRGRLSVWCGEQDAITQPSWCRSGASVPAHLTIATPSRRPTCQPISTTKPFNQPLLTHRGRGAIMHKLPRTRRSHRRLSSIGLKRCACCWAGAVAFWVVAATRIGWPACGVAKRISRRRGVLLALRRTE